MNQETLAFIEANAGVDVRRLALQSGKHPGVDMPFALDQIAGRQAARRKLPSWAAVEGLVYPPHLSMEQCSGEAAARYKAGVARRLCGGGRLVSAEQASGSGETQQSVTTSYSYDEYGRVTQQRQETEAEAGALTVNYRYNAAGQVTAVAYAKESAQGAVDPGNTELHILWYTYDDAGRLSAIHLDEGTASTTSPTNNSKLIRSYAYNAYGEIEKITDNTSFLTGGTLTTELTYTYNDYGLPVKEGAKWRNTRGLGSVTQ